jgi:hypothetical protein
MMSLPAIVYHCGPMIDWIYVEISGSYLASEFIKCLYPLMLEFLR